MAIDMTKYDKILYVGNYIADRIGIVTPIRLQKFCYLMFGFHLAEFDEDLFPNDFEAWDNGPVVRQLYIACKHDRTVPSAQYSEYSKISDEEKETLDFVIKQYKNVSDNTLIAMTHEIGTPWHRVYAKGANNILSKDDIKEYFKNKMKDREFFVEHEKEISDLVYQLSQT